MTEKYRGDNPSGLQEDFLNRFLRKLSRRQANGVSRIHWNGMVQDAKGIEQLIKNLNTPRPMFSWSSRKNIHYSPIEHVLPMPNSVVSVLLDFRPQLRNPAAISA